MNQIRDWLCSDGNNPCEARRFTSLGTRCVFQLAGARLLTLTIALARIGYHNRRRCRVTTRVADAGTTAPGHGAARMLKSRVLNDYECHVNAVAETSARARDRKCVNPRRTHYPGRDSQR